MSVVDTLELQFLIRRWFPDCIIDNILEISTGLINTTWKISVTVNDMTKAFILQKINTDVFRNVGAIDRNWKILVKEKETLSPMFLPMIPDLIPLYDSEKTFLETSMGVFRMTQYIDDSFCPTVVDSPDTAFQVSKEFGRFLSVFSHLSPDNIETIIPDFHNLSLRFFQFNESLKNGIQHRIETSACLIQRTLGYEDIVGHYEMLLKKEILKKRIVHHDTKVSNILLLETTREGLAVIDLDTVMPGYFISDLGDMFRTQICPVDENCGDYDQIIVRLDIFEAILRGYLSEVKDIVPVSELHESIFAGEFMIYMQALRFATDYILGDKYYKISYEDQNFVRWMNQMCLLERYRELKSDMQHLLESIIS